MNANTLELEIHTATEREKRKESYIDENSVEYKFFVEEFGLDKKVFHRMRYG